MSGRQGKVIDIIPIISMVRCYSCTFLLGLLPTILPCVGGKKKPLKAPKKDRKELDEVCVNSTKS